jgi:hypothetical protein
LSRVSFFVLIAVFPSTFAFSLVNAISGVSPEYKEAAQKRQAEIARQIVLKQKSGQRKGYEARSCASFVVGSMKAIEEG